jgi:prephenate dehydrogenase
MEINKVGIVGLGLIGGSIAKALKRSNPNIALYIIDIDSSSLAAVKEQGIADFTSTDDFSILKYCQVIFLCSPVRASISHIDILTGYVGKDTIITDVCSTKKEIVEAAAKHDNITFIGGHPMAGSEKSGYTSSIPHLFENAYYVMCPGVGVDEASCEVLKNIILSFGAIPVKMSPEEHDIVTGSISHLPHVIAASLVNYVIRNDSHENTMKTLAAGGFRDITRIASSSPVMWQNICISNKEPVLSILDKFIDILKEFKAELSSEDSGYLYDFFESAKRFRDSMVINNKSIIPMYFELIADVEDRPGVLGEVATILGNKNINIKNMNISNSRELEGGCLIISFPDAVSRDSAIAILKENGIRCYAK